MNSISERIARVFHVLSDKANAPENQSPEWQAGYAHGLTRTDGLTAIAVEFAKRHHIMSDDFKEWKRGLWAGIRQCAELQSETP